jgi:NTP pyrophosphatase (non-canonical NTP hydrolase)
VAISEELKKVADYYGYEEQSNQLIEECAELIQAINKYRRAGGKGQKTDTRVELAFFNIIEEIADVEVMLDQIKYLLNISEDDILTVKELKAVRQRNRMQGE